MPLTAGTRLGPYEILGPLAAGSMGEVYRARDERLAREVAIKVLPAEVAGAAGSLERFEREARSASALNHPNIVTIYDVGSEGTTSWIAMERVDGKSLRDLLGGSALPARTLLPIAVQISEGLARAHQAGIVHRDLKPENVMVTREGLVKILDFGLAKQTSTTADAEGREGSRHSTKTETSPGTVLGTVGYMSPEQAAGQPADFRSDQFSFGSILYEMAAGKRAFQKKTAIDTLAAILNEEPDFVALSTAETPAPLRWVIERCLAKEPQGRYDSTRDLSRDLKAMSAGSSDAAVIGPSVRPAATARGATIWIALAVALAALAAGAFVGRSLGKSGIAPAIRFQRVTYRKSNIRKASLSPDGQTIVYTAFKPGLGVGLYAIRPGSRDARSLDIADSDVLSISASGEIAFSRFTATGPVLSAAPIGGGRARTILEGADRADWAPDGKSLAVVRPGEEILRIEYPVGKLLYQGKRPMGQVRVSPEGDRVAFGEGNGTIAVLDREGRKTSLPAAADEFYWSPSGKELWLTRVLRDSTEVRAVSLTGRERLLASLPGDFALGGVSRGGRLLLERGEDRWDVLARFPGDESAHSYAWLGATMPTALSADAKTLLFVEKDPGWKTGITYRRATDGSPAVALGEGYCRALSPDGKWAVCREEFTGGGFFLMPTAAGQRKALPDGGLELRMQDGLDWLPDGSAIVFSGNAPGERPRIYRQSVSSGAPVAITKQGVAMGFLAKAVSPDGKLVVGVGPGGWSLYPIDGSEPRPIPGQAAEDRPIQWSRDGRSLFLFRDDEPNKIWLLDVASGQRRLWKALTLEPPDPSAAPGLFGILLTPDGESYVYVWGGWLADLYVLDGLK